MMNPYLLMILLKKNSILDNSSSNNSTRTGIINCEFDPKIYIYIGILFGIAVIVSTLTVICCIWYILPVICIIESGSDEISLCHNNERCDSCNCELYLPEFCCL